MRHTLYAELSPPRQLRLHRQIAETMEQLYADRVGECAGEIAQHYHRSAALRAARGARYVIQAADQAERSAAFVEVVGYLRIALAWLQPDFRYPYTDARLSMASLCGVLGRFEEAAEWFAKASAFGSSTV